MYTLGLTDAPDHLDEAVHVVVHGRHIAGDAHGHHEVDLVQPVTKLGETPDVLSDRGPPLTGLDIEREHAVRARPKVDLALFQRHGQLAQPVVHGDAGWRGAQGLHDQVLGDLDAITRLPGAGIQQQRAGAFVPHLDAGAGQDIQAGVVNGANLLVREHAQLGRRVGHSICSVINGSPTGKLES